MFGKLLTNQKIAHKIVKPYVYKALREGLKTHDNGKIQNLRSLNVLPSESPKINLQYGYHVGQQLNFIPKYNSKVTIGEQFF